MKKSLSFTATHLASFIFVVLLVMGCGLAEDATRTVRFESNGGTAIAEQRVPRGTRATRPVPDPVRNGYIFDKWYLDERLSEVYDFDLPVQQNLTLYARWIFFDALGVNFISVRIQGEDVNGIINESLNPPTIIFLLRNRVYPFGTSIPQAVITSIFFSANAESNKNTNDIINFNENLGDSIELSLAGVTAKKTYQVVVRYTHEPFTSTTYNGSEFLGQAINDPVFSDNTVAVSVSNLAPETAFNFTLGEASGVIASDPNGVLTLTKAQLSNVKMGDGERLMLAFGDEAEVVATYLPYEIRDWRDLQAMRQDLSGDYTLKQDIRFPGQGMDDFDAKGFDPIGGNLVSGSGTLEFPDPFLGSFDGENHTIENFAIQRPERPYCGLFGFVAAPPGQTQQEIKNLTLQYANVEGGNVVGALAGFIRGTIVKTVSVSPLMANGYVKSFWSSASLDQAVGGLVGRAINAELSGYAMGSVQAENTQNANPPSVGRIPQSYVGGLVGRLDSSSVSGYSTVTVSNLVTQVSSTHTKHVGGLVGGLVGNSMVGGYASGDVSGAEATDYTGGLVGSVQRGTVNGYALGNVTNANNAGGLVGYAGGNAKIYGYARGSITRSMGSATNFGQSIGLVNNSPTVSIYHSGQQGESTILPISFTSPSGLSGTSIIISATTAMSDFSDLSFGTNIGQWNLLSGHWPSINLGDDPIFTGHMQPTTP